MVKKAFAFTLILGMGLLFYQLYRQRSTSTDLNKTARYYVENGPKETGSANVVTSVVVTYRGLDTLGEVTILFVAASIIGFFLKNQRNRKLEGAPGETSELLHTGSVFLVPLIFLLGVYVFVNGHLSPGGGFQGGAIIASGTVLLFLADPSIGAGRGVIHVLESFSGMLYVGLAVAGLFLAGGFLDNRIMPLGHFGTLLSAGAIPVIYSLIGLKVGAELSSILYALKDAKE
ncbi:Na(+)/H(+) antiporter subunit B [Myxococcota bacterium]|nr:Na(+)/H(+) antiporter subunit B [Myxococcota bacterium]MBU1535837.1 Na(+)/H(+) antiporter subunit B [Myxococcota bacterium]